MTETKTWQKERMSAMRTKDQAKIAELNKKLSYMNKMSMEMMQTNMKPMMVIFVPLISIFYLALPHCSFTLALSNPAKCDSRRFLSTSMHYTANIGRRARLFWT